MKQKFIDFLYKVLFFIPVILAFSFILMPLNVLFYFGFSPSHIHYKTSNINPLGLTLVQMTIIHSIIGFVAIAFMDKKHWLLSGIMGMLSAISITLFSYFYFGWRETIVSVEILFPLIVGIIPFKMLYDYLIKKFFI